MEMCTRQWFRLNALLSLLLFVAATPSLAQAPASSPAQQPGVEQPQGPREGRGKPLFGKITAIGKGTLELSKLDGGTRTVKINDKTEFRKDRQSAKLGDFKVGDLVMVRAEVNGEDMTALMVAGRTGGGPEGRGTEGPGAAGGRITALGEMGKDFVVGEVKSVDAPQITIVRPDNVTQTLELTEDTSLRKGRDSVTMADIQAGDHVVVRGAMQNNVFISKSVMVIAPEQWKRMQDMGMVPGGGKPPADKPNPPQQ